MVNVLDWDCSAKKSEKLSSNPIALIKCFFVSLKYHSNCHQLFISVKAKVLPSSFDFAKGGMFYFGASECRNH